MNPLAYKYSNHEQRKSLSKTVGVKRKGGKLFLFLKETLTQKGAA